MKRYPILLISLITVSLIIGISYSLHHEKLSQPTLDSLHATLLNIPREIAPFSLIDDKGHEFTNKNLQNKWSLLFFGFTQCGSICPTTLAELAKIYPELAKLPQKTNVIFITVDPDYDTPERMRAYLNSFNTDFIGLTGHPKALADLREQLGILALHHENHATHSAADSVDHSGSLLLINPQGHYVGLFTPPLVAKNILDDCTVLYKLS